jgi:hypothetical protein
MAYRIMGLDPAAFADTAFFGHRTPGLRAVDADGMLRRAGVAGPDEADCAIPILPEYDEVAYINLHDAGSGCFVARAERYDA